MSVDARTVHHPVVASKEGYRTTAQFSPSGHDRTEEERPLMAGFSKRLEHFFATPVKASGKLVPRRNGTP